MRERRLADVPALTSFKKKVRDPEISKSFLESIVTSDNFLTGGRTHTDTMDSEAAETKVQIRLTTRDAGLQISEEPSTLLVQTCKYCLQDMANCTLLCRNMPQGPAIETWSQDILQVTVVSFRA